MLQTFLVNILSSLLLHKTSRGTATLYFVLAAKPDNTSHFACHESDGSSGFGLVSWGILTAHDFICAKIKKLKK